MDRRIQRTHRLLGDALVTLILEKGYDAVTIKDITERADVAYVTFFRHYKEKDDLLFEQLEHIIQELEDVFHGDGVDFEQLETQAYEEGIVIFEMVKANNQLYRILLTEGGTLGVVKRVRDKIAEEARETFDTDAADYRGIVPLDLLAQNLAASLLNLIEWWLVTDSMQTSIEKMAVMYRDLVILPCCTCFLEGLDESISRDTAGFTG